MTDRMKQRYDMSLRCPQLKAGDAVWFHNSQRKKGLTPKLQRPWQGPYTVTKRINDLVYRVQLRPSAKPKVVHRNRLWLYSGDDPPSWFQGPQSQIHSSATQSKRMMMIKDINSQNEMIMNAMFIHDHEQPPQKIMNNNPQIVLNNNPYLSGEANDQDDL